MPRRSSGSAPSRAANGVTELRWLERLSPDRCLAQVTGGVHDGAIVVVVAGGSRKLACLEALYGPISVPDPPLPDPSLDDSRTRAGRLLESLLDATQLAAWRHHQRFWVEVPGGIVELGRLYFLRYRPRLGRERHFCVVPEDHTTLPAADIWTNLLLMLRADPAGFFEVASWRK